MSKKILSLVLALVMVLGTFGTVFASTELTADIEDDAVVEAVERLAAFGIVNGMEDGKYHPELDITREQFAKLVVEATGLGSAANAAVGSTNFKDVETARWSAGYINVASGQGIIKGYPDGTFGPTKQVTYAEAVTMLVRALGYKDEFLAGSWPGNYVAKAAELEITDDVTFLPTGFADRGSVAVMVNNALDAKVIKVDTYEGTLVKFYESKLTLLEDKLSIDKVENIRLIATNRLDDSLASDEIRLLVLKDDTIIDGKSYDDEEEIEIEITEDINAEGLIGLEITGYFDDDLMIYSEIETPKSNFVRGIAYDDEEDGTLYGWTTDKYYDYNNDAVVYINNERISKTAIDLDGNKAMKLNDVLKEYDANYSYAYGNIVLEKGKVAFLDLSVFEVVAGVVQEVDTDDKVIQYINTTDAIDEEDLNLDDYDEYNVLALDGSKMELADIEEGNRIYFYEDAEDDEIAYVMVDQGELVEGTLTEVKTGVASGSYPRGRIYVDDVAISLANDSTYSLDEMDSFQALNRFDNLKNKFDDVFDEDVTVYKDTKGRVALMVTDVNSTTDNYAVVVRSGKTGVRDELKLWTAEDDTVTYEVDEFENGITLNDIDNDDIIKYDINSDGTIDVLGIAYKANGGAPVEDGKDSVIIKNLDKITTKSVLVDGKYYFNDNSSLYFDYSVYNVTKDDEDLDVLTWADFEDTVVPAGVKVVLVTDGDSSDIEFMAFINGYDNIASDDLYVGYLLNSREKTDNMTLTVIEYGKGEIKYTVSKTADKNEFRQNIERPIIYTLSGEGIRLQAPKDDVELVKGLVDSRSGNDLYVNGTKYVMETNVVIYEDDSEIGKFDLVEGYPVIMLLQDGKVAVIAWDYEFDPLTAVKDANTALGTVTAAQTAYTTAGGLATAEDYKAVTTAKTALDAALAATPQVTANIIEATTDLEEAVKALEAATKVLADGTALQNKIDAVNTATDVLELWDALVAAGITELNEEFISAYDTALVGTKDTIAEIQAIIDEVNVVKPVNEAGTVLALRTALTNGEFKNLVSTNMSAYDTALVGTEDTIAKIQAIIDEVNKNIADVASAKSTLETAGTFAAVAQADVNTDVTAKAAVESVIAGLDLPASVTATVTEVSFIAAEAGIAATPAGTNGSYVFTVGLTTGGGLTDASATTASITLVITATGYVAP